MNDSATSIIYATYISCIPPFWHRFAKERAAPNANDTQASARALDNLMMRYRWLGHIGLAGPLIVVLAAPDPGVYSKYGAVVSGSVVADISTHHGLVELATTIAIVSAGFLVLTARNPRASTVFSVMPLLLFSIWVDGKRSAVITSALIIGYALWRHGWLTRARLVVAGTIFVVGFAGFSQYYQYEVRGGISTPTYENLRIDYGRDDVTKLSIHAELNPDQRQVLEHRGQSLLFYATMYVPRNIWEDKPYPYATYMTAAMLDIQPTPLGWGVTTSILEESIANLSWAGMLVGPGALALMCRLGDSRNSGVIGSLTVLVTSLLLVMHLTPFAPLLIVWAVLITMTRRRVASRPPNVMLGRHPR